MAPQAEDDSLVHAARIVSELQLMTSQPWLVSRAARPTHSPPRHARQQEVWYGHFGWAVHDGQRGAFCGAGDDTLHVELPHCRPGWSPSESVLAPFASGGKPNHDPNPNANPNPNPNANPNPSPTPQP